jgi:steroid 5-alpha reductase family enzyme
MWIIFLQGSLLILILMSLLWGLSVILKNVSIVDLFWGPGFIILNAFYFVMSGESGIRKTVLFILVTLWGLRLFIYLAYRNIGKEEDFRYRAFRQKYGPERYWWISYFQTFLLQGALMLIVSFPLLGVNTGTQTGKLIWLDYLAVLVWITGFVFEAGGDFQLSRFRRNPENKGKVLNTGFWRYTRHPNYFGDSAVWWSFAIFSVAAGSYWQIAGSILMTWLIIKVSGVAMLERTLIDSKNPYGEYMRQTSPFFPWFPKKQIPMDPLSSKK